MYNIVMKLNQYTYAVTGCLIGLFIGYMFGSNESSVLKERVQGKDNVATTTDYSIVVSDQPAGESVVVGPVAVPVISWVAIRESNNDVVGRILGAQKVVPGLHDSVTIELLRPTVASVMYAAVFYEDDGNGEFDYKNDKLIEVTAGVPVMSRFVAR
jgi:hypothetical protein